MARDLERASSEPRFFPGEDDVAARDIAVGLYREQHLMIEHVGRLSALRESIPAAIGVVRNRKDGGFTKCGLDEVTSLEVFAGKTWAASNKLHVFLEVVIKRQSAYDSQDAGHLGSLGAAGRGELERPIAASGLVVNLNQLEQFAPLIRLAPLARALADATGLTVAACSAALSMLTWRGVRDSLWLRPLVPNRSWLRCSCKVCIAIGEPAALHRALVGRRWRRHWHEGRSVRAART